MGNNITPDCHRRWLPLLWRPAASGATAGASAVAAILLLLLLIIIIIVIIINVIIIIIIIIIIIMMTTIIIISFPFILPWLEESLRPSQWHIFLIDLFLFGFDGLDD